MLNYKLGQVDY